VTLLTVNVQSDEILVSPPLNQGDSPCNSSMLDDCHSTSTRLAALSAAIVSVPLETNPSEHVAVSPLCVRGNARDCSSEVRES
jgi:hypothetical protein